MKINNKNILLSIVFLFIGLLSFGQTKQPILGVTDTSTLFNTNLVRGHLVYDSTNTIIYQIRETGTPTHNLNTIKKKIVTQISAGGDNIYTTNDTLTGPRTVYQNSNDLTFSGGQTTTKGGGVSSGTYNFISRNSSGTPIVVSRDDTWLGLRAATPLSSEEVTVGGQLLVTSGMSLGSAVPGVTSLNTPVNWSIELGGQTSFKDHVAKNSTWVRVRSGMFQLTGDNITSFHEIFAEASKNSISHVIALPVTTSGHVADAEYRMTSGYWDGAAGQIKVGSMSLRSVNTSGNSEINFNVGTDTMVTMFDNGNVSIYNGHLLRSVENTITASTTQVQGEQPLTKDINEISTVANANDVVTLPSALAGMEIFIKNNGANTLQIFPALGDDLGAGVNISITLIADARITFVSYNSTNWEVK